MLHHKASTWRHQSSNAVFWTSRDAHQRPPDKGCKRQSENNERRCILGPVLGNARTALVSFVASRHPEMKRTSYIIHLNMSIFFSLVSLPIPPNDFLSVLASSLALLNSHSFIYKAVLEQIYSTLTSLNSQDDQWIREILRSLPVASSDADSVLAEPLRPTQPVSDAPRSSRADHSHTVNCSYQPSGLCWRWS